jgi:hypothetical protein
MKKILIAFVCILFIMAFLPFDLAYCQPPPPPGGDPFPCWPPSTCIPIDGGIGFLLAAAAGFGIKKAYDLKKQ